MLRVPVGLAGLSSPKRTNANDNAFAEQAAA